MFYDVIHFLYKLEHTEIKNEWILLSKLRYYVITSTFYSLIKSYFEDRHQRVNLVNNDYKYCSIFDRGHPVVYVLTILNISIVKGNVGVALLKRFKTWWISVCSSLYIIKMLLTYRKYPRILCLIKISESTVFARCCK